MRLCLWVWRTRGWCVVLVLHACCVGFHAVGVCGSPLSGPGGAVPPTRLGCPRKTRNWQGLPAESHTRNSTAAVSEAGVRFHVISSIVCGAPPASAAPMLKVLAPDGVRIVFAASSLERT